MRLTDAEVAIAAARAGAEVVAGRYGERQLRFAKSATDFATQTDLDAEASMITVLQQHRPEDARTGEESGASGGESTSRRWLIDPLCGTLNYSAATPLVVVNVALLSGPTPIAAAAADPIAHEVFWTDGDRAFCRRGERDEPLRPTSRSGLVDINCDGPLDRPFLGAQLVGDSLLRARYGPRVMSSTLALAWVAAGRRTAYISDGDFRGNVHFAAGIAVCQAAGCTVSDLDGNPLHTGRGLLIAADQATHEQLVALVEPHLRAVRDAATPP